MFREPSGAAKTVQAQVWNGPGSCAVERDPSPLARTGDTTVTRVTGIDIGPYLTTSEAGFSEQKSARTVDFLFLEQVA
jgi:hypothetical protein